MKEMIKKLQRKSNKKGFTLVEIIVVLVILAILAAIAVPAVLGYVQDAKDSKYISEARAIYVVVQTEEAKSKAESDDGKTIDTSIYANVISKHTENGTTVPGAAADKTELTDITVTNDGKDAKNRTKYTIKWTSTDGSKKQASLTSNKDVEISNQ